MFYQSQLKVFFKDSSFWLIPWSCQPTGSSLLENLCSHSLKDDSSVVCGCLLPQQHSKWRAMPMSLCLCVPCAMPAPKPGFGQAPIRKVVSEATLNPQSSAGTLTGWLSHCDLWCYYATSSEMGGGYQFIENRISFWLKKRKKSKQTTLHCQELPLRHLL